MIKLNEYAQFKGKHLIEAIFSQKNDKEEVIHKKIKILKEIGLIEDNCCFIVGMDGILNEEECLNMLQVIYVSS